MIRAGRGLQLRAFVCAIFVCYSVCWAVIEPALTIISSQDQSVTANANGWVKYLCFLALSVAFGTVYFLWRHLPPASVSFLLDNTNTRASVTFNDFFAESGHKVIAVNDFFDGQLGDVISERSLHGQFIQRFLGGVAAAFYGLVDPTLPNVAAPPIVRSQGRKKAYPIGTTAVAELNSTKYFFVALTTTDPTTHKVHADVPQLWQALHGLWSKVRACAGGFSVAIPLLGGGPSGVGLPDVILLKLLLASIVQETKKCRITDEIRIVLHHRAYAAKCMVCSVEVG